MKQTTADKPNFEVYDTPADALAATDQFYWLQEGFEYPEDVVTDWIGRHVKVPKKGNVLDLCCGDGIWSKGIRNVSAGVECFGIDLSAGGIEKARKLLETDDRHFVVGDAEKELPFDDGFFDLIFARGPGLYNQHSMDRPATIRVIEMWHRKLKPAGGRFYSIFASDPRQMGTYGPIEQAVLPFNRCPRHTDTVDFQGGKYHHSIKTFLTPFWESRSIEIVDYSFIRKQHILITRAAAAGSGS